MTFKVPHASGAGVPAARVVPEAISPDDYVRDVLPATYGLWGGARTFERYVADFRAMATSAYGKRRRFTVGLREDDRVVASCKNYDREVHWNGKAMRATGIGAVFTDPRYRGRGYASALLGAHLDAERAAGRDLAYLFSDIHPAYYARLGFIALPSRLLTLRASSLEGAAVAHEPLADADWTGVRRCFDALEERRTWGFRRTPLVWDFMRRFWRAEPAAGTQPVQLVVRRARRIVAYSIARRVLRDDALVVDDFGFADDDARALVPPLLRAAAGDLRRVTMWLPPAPARDALPRGSVRARRSAILMVAPLTPTGRAWWTAVGEDLQRDRADPLWAADHV